MADETDEAIIAELRQGSAVAWQSIYRRLQPRIFSYLARLSGDREAAQDLSSEVWCRAAAKLHTLRPDSRLLPWLFTIGRNLFFSYCRWRNRDEHYLNELELVQGRRDPPPTPLDAAIRSERDAALEDALGRLPRIYREAVILVGIEGMAHEEAAAVCGIRANAQRQRFSRGIQLLRDMLSPGAMPANGGGKA